MLKGFEKAVDLDKAVGVEKPTSSKEHLSVAYAPYEQVRSSFGKRGRKALPNIDDSFKLPESYKIDTFGQR